MTQSSSSSMCEELTTESPARAAAHPPAVVLHLPHSSAFIDSAVRQTLCLDDQSLDAELLTLTDWYTDELFAVPASLATPIVYPVSRLVVDPERFIDDADEPQAGVGMGAVYLRTSAGEQLRQPLDDAARARLLDLYYRPHHARLTAAVEDALLTHDHCLVIDCHSFGSLPLPYERDRSLDRPDICIGTDDWHTPPALVQLATTLFEDAGMTVAVNTPFSGALVPIVHYRQDRRVRALMIEVNKRLYMDERSGARGDAFAAVRAQVQAIVVALIDREAESAVPMARA